MDGGKGSGVNASAQLSLRHKNKPSGKTTILFKKAALFCGSVGIFFVLLVASSWQRKLLSADSRVRLGRASVGVGELPPSERWKTSPRGERHYKALMQDDLSSCSRPHVLTDVGARCSFMAVLREVRPRAWIYSARGQGRNLPLTSPKSAQQTFFFSVETTLDSSLLFHITVDLTSDSL